jgi:anti-sigma regulatory factor (Ser/Thr protein kinase)
MSDGQLSLTLPNRRSAIAALADAVDRFGAVRHLSDDDVYNIHLILDEVIVNVIKYGFDDATEHPIDVRLDLEGRVLTIQVEDEGRPFDPTAAPPPDLTKPIEERPIGGLGIHIVKSLAQSIAYRRAGERNILTITKRVSGS